MKYKFKYIGIQRGQDARTRKTYQRYICLRKTKKYYVDTGLTKYRRGNWDGMGVGDWPYFRVEHIERRRPWHQWRHMWE